jgi:hypothetical protein
MNEFEMQEFIKECLELGDELEGDPKIKRIRPFYEAHLLTTNKGLVLTMLDGSEFHVTIVQSKLAEFEEE